MKTSVLEQTMENINATHNEREEDPAKKMFTAKQRARSARQVSKKLFLSNSPHRVDSRTPQ